VLVAQNLSKSFGTKQVLREVSFVIPSGAIFGLLGPNGSGKTTTVRLLNGLLTPSNGSATIDNLLVQPQNPELRRLCGVMTESANLYDDLTGMDNLSFFAQLFSLPQAADRCRELLATFELEHAARQPVRQYSTGMRKRLMLARALLHQPKMLFLDEPTSGLDPESALEVNTMIMRLAREEGVTILLCTHQLKYAEGICSHYGFLDQGVIQAAGTWEDLLHQAGTPRYLELRGVNITHRHLEETLDRRWRIPIADDTAAAETLTQLIQQGAEVYEARQTTLSLEDLYFHIISNKKTATP